MPNQPWTDEDTKKALAYGKAAEALGEEGSAGLAGRAAYEIIRLQAECAALKQAAHRAIVDCAGLIHKADRLESELDEARGSLELLDPRG